MATKKESRARKAAWNKAISEGRVVRVSNAYSFGQRHDYAQEFATPELAQAGLRNAHRAGYKAEIIDPKLAQLDTPTK